MMHSTATLKVLELGPNLIGYYDGRVPGVRLHAQTPNWVDDGGFVVGICSFAIISGRDALIYDTHLTLARATAIRKDLEHRGVRNMRVVLSHWHLDHVAGNAVFQDCEIIARKETVRLLKEHQNAIEAGTGDGPPPVNPLVMPTTSFEGENTLEVGALTIELRPLDIHTIDGLALYMPGEGTLLAGDTLEDTITFVSEPGRLTGHLRDLAKMETWDLTRILPNHGSPETIGGAGYGKDLIRATHIYVEKLIRSASDEALQNEPLTTFLAEPITEGWVEYFAPYEDVHRLNVASITRLGS